MAGPGGAFDVPKVKCPPDRGSLDCVTGSPASISSFYAPSSSPNSTYFKNTFGKHQITQSIDIQRHSSIRSNSASSLGVPPLTPDDGTDSEGEDTIIKSKKDQDALDFLMTVFPRHGTSILPYAKSVSISAPNMGATFEGVVLSLPGQPKSLYVDGNSAQSVNFRESIVALLDLADESLQCSTLVIVLDRGSPSLGTVLHSLMYVGGAVITKPAYEVASSLVMVGMEI